MNPLLSRLQPYPFERLRQLFASVTPPAHLSPISLGMGEPRHATPAKPRHALPGPALPGLACHHQSPSTTSRSTRKNSAADEYFTCNRAKSRRIDSSTAAAYVVLRATSSIAVY